MDAELKAKWLAALRSGAYRQGQNVLYNDAADSYCCIGVLCTVMGMEKNDDPDGQCFTSERSFDWRMAGGMHWKTGMKLASMNDEGASFAEIADYIEQNIPAESSSKEQSNDQR